jgi:excisionase family DNA binding protein
MASNILKQLDEMGDFLTVKEVAGLLRLSKMTVYRMGHEGTLKMVRVSNGRAWMIINSSVVAHIEKLLAE